MVRTLMILAIVILLPVFLFAFQGVQLPQGILMGEDWHPVMRELKTVYPDQKTLDLGESGIRKVQFWAEIRNAAGRQYTWVVRYGNGIEQTIMNQKIRYDRFRMYIEKTFRRKIWDADARSLRDVTGPCKILLVDPDNPGSPVAVKELTIR